MAAAPVALDPVESPQSPSEIPPESPYGEDNRDLPPQLVEALRSTIIEFQGQGKFLRRREVKRDWKLRLYQEGYQHLQWTNAGFSPLVGGQTVTNAAGGSMQCPTYMDAYNIVLRFFLIIQAVLTQALPAVRWQPMDPGNPDDIDKTKEAQNYAKLFDRYNDLKDILGQIVRMLGMSGRTVSWTRTEEDAQRFGFEADGTTPKRFQRTTIHGTLETKVFPITAREFDGTCLGMVIYHDYDVRIAKDRYPWKAVELKAGGAALGENQYERTARLGVLGGTRGEGIGDSLSNILSGGDFFLRPAAFTGPAYDEQMEGSEGTIKQALLDLFPQGVRAVFEGDVYCTSFAKSMDDQLDIQFPYQGDGMARQGFMQVMAIVQDNFNDLCNWIREKVDTGAGATWVNGTQDEIDTVTSQRAAPNAIRAGKQFKAAGEPMADAFFQESDPQIPETLFKLLEFMRGDLPEFLLAALPSLQGGETPDNGTASGYAMATANAKGQLNILWSRMQRMFARIRYQSVLAAAADENASGVVSIPGGNKGETISVDFDALRKGNFGCYADEDSGFPETTSAKRGILKEWIQLAGASPMAAQLFDNPDNIEQMKELNGFQDLTFIPAEARTKQLFEIERLLQEAPIPPDPAMVEQAQTAHAAAATAAKAAGMPIPPFAPPQAQTSVPVQKSDYHEYEGPMCKEWLSSKARRDAEKPSRQYPKGNAAGVQNVFLHWEMHEEFLAQAQAAMMAMAPPQGDGGKGQPSPPKETKPTPGTQVPTGA